MEKLHKVSFSIETNLAMIAEDQDSQVLDLHKNMMLGIKMKGFIIRIIIIMTFSNRANMNPEIVS
jgi:hypothetical protein